MGSHFNASRGHRQSHRGYDATAHVSRDGASDQPRGGIDARTSANGLYAQHAQAVPTHGGNPRRRLHWWFTRPGTHSIDRGAPASAVGVCH
eukprot:7379466-Prymnesium_polylepis.4